MLLKYIYFIILNILLVYGNVVYIDNASSYAVDASFFKDKIELYTAYPYDPYGFTCDDGPMTLYIEARGLTIKRSFNCFISVLVMDGKNGNHEIYIYNRLQSNPDEFTQITYTKEYPFGYNETIDQFHYS